MERVGIRTVSQRGSTAPAVPGGPRRVRWRRPHARSLLVGLGISLTSIAAVATLTVHQGSATRRAEQETRKTTAVITRHWITGVHGHEQFWVAYRYPQLPASEPDPVKSVPPLWWAAMNPGKKLTLLYHPAAPEVNELEGNRPHLYQRWLTWGAPACVALGCFPLLLYVVGWRQRRHQLSLVQSGKSVVGEVVDVVETMVPRGQRARWHYDVAYRFPLPDGSMQSALHRQTSPDRMDWAVGRLVAVFFDPSHPERHALYADLPGEVMSAG